MKSKEYIMLEEEIKEDIKKKLRELPALFNSLAEYQKKEIEKFINEGLPSVPLIYSDEQNIGYMHVAIKDGQLVFVEADAGLDPVSEHTPSDLAEILDELDIDLIDLGVVVSSLYEEIGK